ncbi:MAG: dihydroorotase [Flavobacteriales bacterium]|nr:dihydroorotase [Flavobacteriales bacterium]
MSSIVIKNVLLINEGKRELKHVLIKNDLIHSILDAHEALPDASTIVDGTGKWLFPGVIDDQVHFREPGLTHKGEIATESRAAVAGGITSFMEMPNTVPNALTQELLQDKYDRAAEVSPANYSFFMGASNDNIDEVLKTDPKNVCGIKVFMGSSTGNMLVDAPKVLEGIFKESPMLVATHCEDEATIRANMAAARAKYGEDVPMNQHPVIRDVEACYRSSSMAVELAEKFNTRLHILHISTAKEVALFRNDIPIEQKRITAEACIHHLWFTDEQYNTRGSLIKWNPAVKSAADREEIRKGILDGRIDVIATDHAPHTMEEKRGTYFNAPSGGPLVQHALVAVLEMVHQGIMALEEVPQLMSHNVARCFDITNRGYVRPGYKADLVMVDPQHEWTVSKENILYKCGWSPFEGDQFTSKIAATWVNGNLVYDGERVIEGSRGERMVFNR